MHHSVSKILEIVDRGLDDRRSILQLGYNLGRLSEITGQGRGPFWDTWKDAVESWDLPRLRLLSLDLEQMLLPPPHELDGPDNQDETMGLADHNG